ncbi:hypothetical protein M569_15932 [Genlisea aurea]|uniref:Probable purine permease n=1 Tax=Genlisea aurea TaxID=192259 RepID=S8C3F8_9LAMI|nr:hypothetical protein M569_15932 [Genlisea aurea]
MRLYFAEGGGLVWFLTWLSSAGCPIILLPLAVNYVRRRSKSAADGIMPPFFIVKPKLLVCGAAIGIIAAADNYFYVYGMSKLPVSTFAIIGATQLAFTAGFAFLIVKQKFTPYSINAVVLLTAAAAVLSLDAKNVRLSGEPSVDYWTGFCFTAGEAVLFGLIMSLVELSYSKSQQPMTYGLVLEFQLAMCSSACVCSAIGMAATGGFAKIRTDAAGFESGRAKYCAVALFTAAACQCFFLGAIGVVCFSSSLFSGVVLNSLLVLVEICAVVFFHDEFGAGKAVALFLSLWGFASYSYGEYRIRVRVPIPGNDDDNVPSQA